MSARKATIIVDTERLLPDAQVSVRVDNVGDYAAACLALRAWLHAPDGQQGGPITIRVRNRSAAVWLRGVADAYGDSLMALRRYTPRDALAKRWATAVPSAVTDQDIMTSRLLEESVAVRPGLSFWDLLLDHFYGEAFTYAAFPAGKLADLLNAFDPLRWKDAARRPLVSQAWRERAAQWQRSASSEAVRQLVRRLDDGPEVLRRDVARYKLVRTYPPAVGEKVLGVETWDVLHKARVETEDVHLDRSDSVAVTQIEYYLTEASTHVHSSNDLAVLLDQMSGYVLAEFEAIEQLVVAHPAWLDSTVLRLVDQRFRPLRDELAARLAALRRLVPPPYPVAPQQDWSIDEWLGWVRNSYMPYYSWLDVRREYDPTVGDYAEAFADWYYAHFVELKNGAPGHFAFNALYQERERMSEPGAITLALVLDNVNFAFVDDLCRLFNAQQFLLQDSRPLLSLIPTATEISKANVIAGVGDHNDLTTKNYPALVDKSWQPILHEKRVTYLPNIGALQGLGGLDHDMYVLNYLRVDKLLHDDEQELGRPHVEAVHEALSSVVDAVAHFAKRFHIEDRLLVYVISDHGSTRIAQEEISVLDKDFYKGVARESSRRYVELTDQKVATLPQMATAQCYIVDRHRFKTAENYLIARRYYRFLETSPTVYVHGGLTPEEVVVPLLRFTRQPVVPVAPTVRLTSREFRYGVKATMVFEIGNPNSFTIEDLSGRLTDADSDDVLVDTVGPKQAVPVEFVTRFRKTLGAPRLRMVTLRLSYECQGRVYGPQDETFEITLKSLQEALDDDLDF